MAKSSYNWLLLVTIDNNWLQVATSGYKWINAQIVKCGIKKHALEYTENHALILSVMNVPIND